MFADEKPTIQPKFNLASMGEAALLDLRAQIDANLPVKSLKDIDLERELVLQYQTVKALQNAVIDNEEIDVNKRAQVVNSCAAALDSLVKMQERYVNSQRMMKIEGILIDTLNDWPHDQVASFLEKYAKNLEKVL